jgi:hypothetical protein
MLLGLRGLEALTSHVFRILFVPDAAIDEETSTDQEFGTTRVFRPHHELALSIDAGGLDAQELSAVQPAPVEGATDRG